MIEVVRKVIKEHEHDKFMKYGIDTLIRINEKKCFIDCNNCSFRDIEADILVCPHRYLIKVEVL